MSAFAVKADIRPCVFETEDAQPQESPNRAAGLYLLSSWASNSR